MFEKLRTVLAAFRNLTEGRNDPPKGLELWRVSIPESDLHQDWQICDRYQAFSTEIARISALGIAGIGFLYEQALKDKSSSCASWPAILSAILFACAAAFALLHRYYSTDAMSCQIRYLRIRSRLNEPHLDEGVKANLKRESSQEGGLWRGRLAACGVWLGLASFCLGLAGASLAVCFACLLKG